MPIEEVILALKGFAGAYGKVAENLLPSSSHELRISAVEKSSFDLAILAWIASSQGNETLSVLKTAGSAAKYVFSIVAKIIDVKKHTKSKPYQIAVEGSNNTTIIINNDGGKMEFPREALEILTSKLVDTDLARIASPLSDNLIINAELTATDEQGSLEANIASTDKEYFVVPESEETGNPAEISGTLVSLNKETLRGTFKRTDGLKIPYRYIGENPQGFWASFSHKGAVRVSCIAYFDENLELKRLEIQQVIRLQGELTLSPPEAPQAPQ
jgi:hypothetical protein